VYGPPGSGKSRAVYNWVHSICSSFSEIPVVAIWISISAEHAGEDKTDNCWEVRHDAGEGRVKVSSAATPTRADDVSYAHIIVFDGGEDS
jgi:hypothetical protein